MPVASILAALLSAHMLSAPMAEGLPRFQILFLGNSHTLNHDVPSMVEALLKSVGYIVTLRTIGGGLLDDLATRTDVRDAIATGKWTHVVLQGANMSSSHKFEYSKQKPIELAKWVLKSGSKPLLFAEHPRRGWKEAAWIVGQYSQIQKAVAGGKSPPGKPGVGTKSSRSQTCPIVPCPFAFEIALGQDPGLDLWEPDGNHANLAGAYLNALTIAFWLAGSDAKLSFAPKGLSPAQTANLQRAARQAVKSHM